MANLSDMHIHIDYFKDYLKFYKSLEEQRIYSLFVTNLPEIFQKSITTFPSSKYVKIAIGYNPQFAKDYEFNKSLFDKLLPLTKYIGEVGLDYSNEFKQSKNRQIDAFEHICNRASTANKLLSIHSRKAEDDVLDILLNNKVKHAVFHWYSGKKSKLFRIIEEGYYFSVNYSMLNSKSGRDIIKSIPLDRLLIETDAPFGKTFISGKEYNLKQVYNTFSLELNINKFEDKIYANLFDLLNSIDN